jgi:hypothetical protein
MGAVKEALINNIPYRQPLDANVDINDDMFIDDDSTLSLSDESMEQVGDEMQTMYVNELGEIKGAVMLKEPHEKWCACEECMNRKKGDRDGDERAGSDGSKDSA